MATYADWGVLLMRKRVVTKLPLDWSQHPRARGVVAEFDVRPHRGRLALKVLVFKSPKEMAHNARHMLGLDTLTPRLKEGNTIGECQGFVNPLSVFVEKWDRNGKLQYAYAEVDKRYFAVMGLVVTSLRSDVIVHESVHAAFAYAKRVKNDWDGRALSFDEEEVCYPAGEIAQAINNQLHTLGLYGAQT